MNCFSPDEGNYEVIKPRFVSVERDVPDHIKKPKYYYQYQPPDIFSSETAEIKGERKINKMRDSCRLAANILEKCSKLIQVCGLSHPFLHLLSYVYVDDPSLVFIAWNNHR